MEIIVEKLKLEELSLFWEVFSKVLKTGFPGYTAAVIDFFLLKAYNQASFYYWLKTGWKEILIAKTEGKIIGFAVIDKPYGGVSFLRWLGVLKEFQKRGAGRKLIDFWLKIAQEEGCHKAELAAQKEAKGFYEKCGLKLEGKRDLSYFGIDQFIFGKVLGEPKDEVMTRE